MILQLDCEGFYYNSNKFLALYKVDFLFADKRISSIAMQFGHNVKLNHMFYLRLLTHPLPTAGPRHKNLQKNKPSYLFKLSGQLSNTGGRTYWTESK